jgi:hypothetical protein
MLELLPRAMIHNPAYLKSGVFSFLIHASIFLYAYLQFDNFGNSKALIHTPINVSLIQEQAQKTAAKSPLQKQVPQRENADTSINEFKSQLPILSSTKTDFTQAEISQEEEVFDINEELTLQYFVNMIIGSVEAAWRKPINIQEGLSAQFLINVSKSGKILGYQLHKSSGNIRFDNSGLSAIKRVDRFIFFDDLPSELYESELKTFILDFNP